MKKNLKGFILGILFTVLVMQLIMPINAAMLGKTIQVMTGINIYMDDVKLTPKDSKGNSVEPFIYNGTTYLPLRAVAEALNKAVTWEGKTSSVYLGKHDSATPAVMLYDMDYFNSSGEFGEDSSVTDNFGVTYHNALRGYDGQWQEYLLNGKYSRLNGKVVLRYAERSYDRDNCYVKIYVDDRLVYTTPPIKGGSPNAEFDIDLTGALKVKVQMYGSYKILAIVDAGLYQ